MEILQRASLLGSYVAAPPSTSTRSFVPSPSSKRVGSSSQVCIPRSGRIPRLVTRAGRDNDRNEEEDEDVEQDMSLNQEIPATSDGFLKRVSSRAYDMRRKLERTLESNSYDVLESNPWREDSKAVYVLAQKENQLLTMRTRRERNEVSRELSLLFPKRGNRRGRNGVVSPGSDSPFRMQVEDIREGVLVFEDENEAARYCSLLDGICRGIAEIEASDVFALCKNNKTLAVLFRRGTVPPQPDRLQKNLNSRNHSLED